MNDDDVTWAANWYKTRRHIDVNGLHALCSPYTKTWPDGYHSTDHAIPASDDLALMAMKPCGLCVRKAKAAS